MKNFLKLGTDTNTGDKYHYYSCGLGVGFIMLFAMTGVTFVGCSDDFVTPQFQSGSVSGTINGYEYVDLGLSVKWATCNVGAESPGDYGDYYAWGEIEQPTDMDYSNSNCRFFENSTVKIDGVTYSEDEIGGNAATDAATANWGGTWRMPTKDEFDELIDNCTWTWMAQDEIGYLVTGTNGNSIFLPAAGQRYGSSLYDAGESGFYWSSNSYNSNPYVASTCAYYLCFGYGTRYTFWCSRSLGFSVRPVSE